MPPEKMELWARRLKIKEGLAASWALRLAQLALFFLEDAWMIVLQLPAFPKGQWFGWIWVGEETVGVA